MATGNFPINCPKCNKVAKEGSVKCGMCEARVHNACYGIGEDSIQVMTKNKLIMFFCHVCHKTLETLKDFGAVAQSLKQSQTELTTKVQEVIDQNKNMSADLGQIKNALSDNETTATINVDLKQEMTSLKNELKNSFSDIVKKDIDDGFKIVKSEVKGVQMRLDKDNEIKKRENNIVVFGLNENTSYESDKIAVLKMLQHLSNDAINNCDNFKVNRIGKKDEKTIRPMLIVFRDSVVKGSVMKCLNRMKDLPSDYHKVAIRHDLTLEQRNKLNKLLKEAKEKETTNKDGFLYRVRGEIDQWRIVSFRKSQ